MGPIRVEPPVPKVYTLSLAFFSHPYASSQLVGTQGSFSGKGGFPFHFGARRIGPPSSTPRETKAQRMGEPGLRPDFLPLSPELSPLTIIASPALKLTGH